MWFSNKIYQISLIFSLFLLVVNGCKKKTIELEIPQIDSIYDVDSNVYKTMKIGNQWWMIENLKVKKFRNGVPINSAQSSNSWKNKTSSYCLYDANSNAPGLLYNWYAVVDSNEIAPEGWHIPTDDDWKVLEKYLGMTQLQTDSISWRGKDQGDQLKIKGLKGWKRYEDVWPTNKSGFTALAGGCRLQDGVWADPGLSATGFWWTATENSISGTAWYRHLDYKKENIFRHSISKNYGMSIRCVKDIQ
jgi:uncharacterized protein (TIGR02145 family)